MTQAHTPLHVCGLESFKPGDPAPSGYIQWHEWARVQSKAGLKQRTCGVCSRWMFPQELSKRTIKSEAIDARTLKRVRSESPVCLECNAKPSRAPKRAKKGNQQ